MKFYITTAIDYVNSLPHIGTAYEKIGADVLARWHRLLGDDVHFQMGNDEHSLNVQRAAKKAGLSPKVYCDRMREKFEEVWKKLNISYDGFIQTSERHHEEGVKKLFQKIFENGDIVKKPYEGWYCESCEAFYTEKDLVDGICPNHKTKPTWLKEENYFFCLSRYRDRLLTHIKTHPEFIQPDMRRNEILALLESGLEDISVSRSSFDWGIPLPDDPQHVVYVWFDALINYITAIGYGWDDKKFSQWWPGDVHVIGKDITRFHCVIWPAMLMSAGLPLPLTVFGHGFISFKGEKMSKTLGNVVTPLDVIDKYGADPLRYYLLRAGSFGQDSDFTWEQFIHRYNGELANGLGNLVSRTIGMAMKYQNGIIRAVEKNQLPEMERDFFRSVSDLRGHFASTLHLSAHNAVNKGDVQFHLALSYLWDAMSAIDLYINAQKPWELAKKGDVQRINEVLYCAAENLFEITVHLFPFMPETAQRIWNALSFDQFGALKNQRTPRTDMKPTWGRITKQLTCRSIALFPRIEEAGPGTDAVLARPPEKESLQRTKEKSMQPDLIDIADFGKIDLRAATILTAERIEGATRLLKIIVDVGSEQRQIVAGIAEHYTPEELIGKQVAIVANLKPAKLKGVESHGMLLAASDANAVSILTPLKPVAAGSKVK